MKRRDFFKRLGITAGTIAVAPSVLATENIKLHDDLTDFSTFFPMGNKTKYGFDELTYPKITFDFDKKRIFAGGGGRFTIQHVYEEVVAEFDKPHNLYNEIPMMAYHPTGFALLDGWDFGFDYRRLCGGSWECNTSFAYANVYGIGSISEPSYIHFKYMTLNNHLDMLWTSIGRGIITESNQFLFDRCILIDKTKKVKIIIGAFNSRNELLDVFNQEFRGYSWRLPYPFMISFPITKHTHNCAMNKYRSYL